MKHLQRSMIFLLIGLTIFFNIERVDIGSKDTIDIQSFVYILGALAVISVIGIRFLRRSSLYISVALWLGVYLCCKLFLFTDRPLFGDIYTYLSITEMTLLWILIGLAHIVARAFSDFQEAVENITLSDVSHRVLTLSEAENDIHNELTRSRRYHRPLSVVVVEPDPDSIQISLHRTVREVQQSMMTRYVITSLARVFDRVLRRIDLIITQQEQGRFVILCPETDAAGSGVVMDRVREAISNQLGVSVRCGAASFPDEALTFEELVSQAELQMQPVEKLAEPVEQVTPSGDVQKSLPEY
jgi:GGDEF domain-containing protein